MKKLMLLAAVAAAFAANAAQFAWKNGYEIAQPGGSSLVLSGTVYLFETGTKSQSDVWQAFYGGASLATFGASYALNEGTLDGSGFYVSGRADTESTLIDGALVWNAGASYTVGDPYGLYQVVQVDDSLYFSEVITKNLLENGKTSYTFSNDTSTSAATEIGLSGAISNDGGWYKMAPVPEPTSGLLMLVGLSLLGLRRKPRA